MAPGPKRAIRVCGNLSGKVLIDCTNPLASDLSGLVVGTTTSGGEQVGEVGCRCSRGEGVQHHRGGELWEHAVRVRARGRILLRG